MDRILAVADDKQVLYSFIGVDIDSVELLTKKTFNAKIPKITNLPYRCAKNIVKLAQEIVPDIEAAPNAKNGEVLVHLRR